jgi:ATP-dependent exoDNAse (exonuclease V) beta subunit
VQPSDIAIVLRRFTKVRLFEEALASAAIPYEAQQGAGFFQRPEIVDLTNLLTWLAEPDDDIALVGVLRSPLFLLDDETLFRLRRERRPFILSLREPPEDLDAGTSANLPRVATTLDELGSLAERESIDVLLASVLAATGFEAAWASQPDGERAVANVRKLVRLAQSLRSRSLDEFVGYIERRRDELETREGQAVLDQANAVRILTVHGAKGLEFPVVFLAEANLLPRPVSERVIWHRELGVSVTLAREDGDEGSRPRPGFYSVLLRHEKEEEVAEYRRLFYVACTRAGDYLYITGDAPGRVPREDWLAWTVPVVGSLPLDRVEVRPTIPVDIDAIRRAAPALPVVPPVSRETDYMSPLILRPPVIPLRSSTPVTALLAEREFVGTAHGDGLATFRGVLAHRVLQLKFTTGEPDVRALAEQLRDRPIGEAEIGRLAEEVQVFLARFEATDLGQALTRREIRYHFELPFAWDWDGVPIHGVIDLLYQDASGQWHVVDFKTDALSGQSPLESARPYLAQLGLYGLAVQAAVGTRPTVSICFLRTGEVLALDPDDVETALTVTRHRVDQGSELAPTEEDLVNGDLVT